MIQIQCFCFILQQTTKNDIWLVGWTNTRETEKEKKRENNTVVVSSCWSLVISLTACAISSGCKWTLGKETKGSASKSSLASWKMTRWKRLFEIFLVKDRGIDPMLINELEKEGLSILGTVAFSFSTSSMISSFMASVSFLVSSFFDSLSSFSLYWLVFFWLEDFCLCRRIARVANARWSNRNAVFVDGSFPCLIKFCSNSSSC